MGVFIVGNNERLASSPGPVLVNKRTESEQVVRVCVCVNLLLQFVAKLDVREGRAGAGSGVLEEAINVREVHGGRTLAASIHRIKAKCNRKILLLGPRAPLVPARRREAERCVGRAERAAGSLKEYQIALTPSHTKMGGGQGACEGLQVGVGEINVEDGRVYPRRKLLVR